MAIVNSATLGDDSSMINKLNILPQYKEYIHLNTATTGLNNATAWIGDTIGWFFIQPASDNWGGKTGIVIAAIICFVGSINQSCAQNTAMFVIGRMITGLGAALSSGAAPTLVAEILPATLRGSILGFNFSCFYVGSLITAGVTYGTSSISTTWAWRLPSLLQFVPSTLALAALPFVPESPRWLISRGMFEYAREVLTVVPGLESPGLSRE